MAASEVKQTAQLQILPSSDTNCFETPKKEIHEAKDVEFFLTSKAYTDILAFLLQLNASVFPRSDVGPASGSDGQLDPRHAQASGHPLIAKLASLLTVLSELIDQAPPDPGPRRFGNISFRKWFELVEARLEDLLSSHLPQTVVDRGDWSGETSSPELELKAYLLGSFGSSQRLDYGTGHELSFLAFLGCIWKLGGFESLPSLVAEREIVLGLINPYLALTRRLITTYNLEPAGSHGVWGLDDHSFLPYIFGSAQLAPPIKDADSIPAEGSSPDAPNPGDITNRQVVDQLRGTNMYFGAIGFIYDVKRGPFWEHSPTLYDISGVKAGWAKINKGMIKMYIAEVLSKFPVVQHFPFGHMFRWERDPQAAPPANAANTHQPASAAGTTATAAAASNRPPPGGATLSTPAPWASSRVSGVATAGGASGRQPTAMQRAMPPPRLPSAGSSTNQTKAPWAKDR